MFDSELCLDKQTSSAVKNSYYQLRTISKRKQILSSVNDLENVIHAFILSKLDYGNSFYLGLPQCSLTSLQMVQNEAAKILTGT